MIHQGEHWRVCQFPLDSRRFRFEVIENPKIHSIEKYPRWMEKSETIESTIRKNAKSLRKQGYPLYKWMDMIERGDLGDKNEKENIVFISNGIQTNFISGWGSFVRNRVVVRQAYAIQNLPFSSCTALVIEPKDYRGIRTLCINTKTNKCKMVEKAICGCVLLRNGRSHEIETSLGKSSRVDAVLWDPKTTRAAFSAVGFTKSYNNIIFVAVEHPILVGELAKWMRDSLGVVDAILCGGSADVQQIIPGHKPIFASSRSDSTNPGSCRNLNCVFVVYAPKGEPLPKNCCLSKDI